MNLPRVRKSGVLSRHRHPQGVHGFVLKCAGTTSTRLGGGGGRRVDGLAALTPNLLARLIDAAEAKL